MCLAPYAGRSLFARQHPPLAPGADDCFARPAASRRAIALATPWSDERAAHAREFPAEFEFDQSLEGTQPAIH
jgi:hypothetical protein